MGFTQQYVSRLLGHRGTGLLSKFEQGRRFPNIPTAIKLAAIYRASVDFLYWNLYDKLRTEIREAEDKMLRISRSAKSTRRNHGDP